jgi:hypothetical protein
MERQQYNFQATQSLSLGNSFGTIKTQKDIILEVTVGIKDEHGGWFEIYDEESGGEEWYAEGCIDFDGMTVVGYDGCFDLPKVVCDKLEELGYTLDL